MFDILISQSVFPGNNDQFCNEHAATRSYVKVLCWKYIHDKYEISFGSLILFLLQRQDSEFAIANWIMLSFFA